MSAEHQGVADDGEGVGQPAVAVARAEAAARGARRHRHRQAAAGDDVRAPLQGLGRVGRLGVGLGELLPGGDGLHVRGRQDVLGRSLPGLVHLEVQRAVIGRVVHAPAAWRLRLRPPAPFLLFVFISMFICVSFLVCMFLIILLM